MSRSPPFLVGGLPRTAVGRSEFCNKFRIVISFLYYIAFSELPRSRQHEVIVTDLTLTGIDILLGPGTDWAYFGSHCALAGIFREKCRHSELYEQKPPRLAVTDTQCTQGPSSPIRDQSNAGMSMISSRTLCPVQLSPDFAIILRFGQSIFVSPNVLPSSLSKVRLPSRWKFPEIARINRTCSPEENTVFPPKSSVS